MEQHLHHPFLEQRFRNDHKCCASTQLYDRYFNRIFPICYRLDHLSGDALQKIFANLSNGSKAHAMLNICTFQQRYKISSLAANVGNTYYVAIQMLRREGRRIENELREVFEKFVASLPGKRKTIFLMFYQEEFAAKDIAGMFNGE